MPLFWSEITAYLIGCLRTFLIFMHTHKNWFKTQSFFHPSQSASSKSDIPNNIQQASTRVATFVSTHTKIMSPCIHMWFLLMCALVCLCNLCLCAHEARVGLCECLNGFSRAPRYWCHVWEVFSLIYWPWQPLPLPLSPSPPLPWLCSIPAGRPHLLPQKHTCDTAKPWQHSRHTTWETREMSAEGTHRVPVPLKPGWHAFKRIFFVFLKGRVHSKLIFPLFTSHNFVNVGCLDIF